MTIVDSSLEKLQSDKRLPIWLIWSLNYRGLVSLRAICASQSKANQYRKYVSGLGDGNIIRTWIEKTICNYLFGEGEHEKNYPDIGMWNMKGDNIQCAPR